MKPPGPGAVAGDSYGAVACGVVPPARAHLQGPRSRRGTETVAEREMPPGIPRPGGMQTITSLSFSPVAAPAAAGGFFAPGLGRGGGKSVTGKDLRSGWWVKGESWGPPTPTRAGAGVFFVPLAEESALFAGKIAVMTAETPEFSCDLTLFSIGGYNEFANPEERVLFPAGENRIERISTSPPLQG